MHDQIGTGIAPFFTGEQKIGEVRAAFTEADAVAGKGAGFIKWAFKADLFLTTARRMILYRGRVILKP